MHMTAAPGLASDFQSTPEAEGSSSFVVRRWGKRWDRPGTAGDEAAPNAPENAAQRCGRWLFEHRSYTLVPLAALIVAAAWTGIGQLAAAPLVVVAVQCLGLALLVGGEAVRFSVAARAHRGTSGRGTILRAPALVTGGLYAYSRNPLYLANLTLWVGASLLIPNVPLALLAAVVVGWQYHLVIQAEERFLQAEHGEAYRRYCRMVPRLLPGLGFRSGETAAGQRPGVDPAPVDWRRGLFREHDTIFLILLGVWGVFWLQALRASAHSPSAIPDWAWIATIVAPTGGWLAVKTVKRVQKHTRRRKHTLREALEAVDRRRAAETGAQLTAAHKG
jgi:protein-S-isoprenylcysteine O-methyltransferase Ste14